MATAQIAPLAGTANSSSFAAALEAVQSAEQSFTEGAPTYQRALARLIATPAPDIGALAAKIELADPFEFDHHYALLADARRLAGLA